MSTESLFSPGDILLFSGNAFFSNVIKLFTRSHWSHVGIVVEDVENGVLCCLESDESPLCQGETKTGVRLTEINRRIDLYPGEVGIRRFLKRDSFALSLDGRSVDSMMKGYVPHIECKLTENKKQKNEFLSHVLKINEFYKTVEGISYEKHYIDLFRAVYDGPGGQNHGDLSSLFCSELVAKCLMYAGIIDESLTPDEYTPADISKLEANSMACTYSSIEFIKKLSKAA